MPGHYRAIGPVTLQGAAPRDKETTNNAVITLKVVAKNRTACAGIALAHPEDVAALQQCDPQLAASCDVQLATGSDCMLRVRADDGVARGCIALDDVQQHNMRILTGGEHEFRIFGGAADGSLDLVDLDAEVRLLDASASASGVVQVDATKLAAQLKKHCFGKIVAVNEELVLDEGHTSLVIRITATNALTEQEQEDAIGYHCYRGRVMPDTAVYLSALQLSTAGAPAVDADTPSRADASTISTFALRGMPDPASTSTSPTTSTAAPPATTRVQSRVQQGSTALRLVGAATRAARPPSTNIIRVHTSDGEVFPVRRKVLRPCIQLTKVVRSQEAAPQVLVDIDTLTFDRVLIFLEAELLGKPQPAFSIHYLEDLLQAGCKLGLRSLQDHCEARINGHEAALRWYRFDEVQQRNAQGECLLVLDGMVLDVTRWLPEHPGGATIIPRQSLNMDCARFFEMYHASQESFLYLREFYRGEIAQQDRDAVPTGKTPASPEFLQQLSSFTNFRMAGSKAFKSF